MQQSIVKIYGFVVQTPLNIFRALLCPLSGARQTAVAASGFRMNVEVLSRGRPGIIIMPIIRSPWNCRCSLWFPYECGGGSVLSRGRPGIIILPIIRSPWNCRCSLWFPYECGGGSVLSRGRFVGNKPTTAESSQFYDWLLHLVGCFIRVIEDARNHKP